MSVGEEPETVEDVYEPFLLKSGLVMRTPRGRIAAPAAYEHLGLPVPEDGTGPQAERGLLSPTLFDDERAS